MNKFYVFVIRAILGAFFAVIMMRFFYRGANPAYAVSLGIFLVGMAYMIEFFRTKK